MINSIVVFGSKIRIRLFRIISIPSKFFIFVCQTSWFWWNVRLWTSSVKVNKENSNRCVAL